MIRLLLALEHALVREGVKRVLGECDDIAVVAESHAAPELRADLARGRHDVVMAGVRSLEAILETAPAQRVLVLGESSEEEAAQRALRFGATGYLYKDSAVEDLARLVRLVHAGQRVICVGAEPVLLEASGPTMRLSTRELAGAAPAGHGRGARGRSQGPPLEPEHCEDLPAAPARQAGRVRARGAGALRDAAWAAPLIQRSCNRSGAEFA